LNLIHLWRSPCRDSNSMDLSLGFPVKTKLYSRSICGTPTDFSFSAYDDHLLLIITQLGTSGTVIAASTDTAFNSSTPTYSTSVLMGKRDEPLLTICARRIMEAAGQAGCMRPMIICLGLRSHTPDALREVCTAVGEDNLWS